MLDATYARLYGLTRDELRYTLRVDPKEVHGEDFPGETFRVLKEKEVRLYVLIVVNRALRPKFMQIK